MLTSWQENIVLPPWSERLFQELDSKLVKPDSTYVSWIDEETEKEIYAFYMLKADGEHDEDQRLVIEEHAIKLPTAE